MSVNGGRGMQRRALVVTMAITLAWTLAGCAKPPQAAIDGAKQSIDAARSAEAGTYAPDAFRTAEDATVRLDAELRAQDQKAAFLRSYKRAAEFAEAAQVAAHKAAVDADAGKEKARQRVTLAIETTREAAGQARAAVDKLPKTAAAQAARQSIEAALAAAEAVLADAESALTAGKLQRLGPSVRHGLLAPRAKSRATRLPWHGGDAHGFRRAGLMAPDPTGIRRIRQVVDYSSTVKTEPCGWFGSTKIRPPWASATIRQNVRPRLTCDTPALAVTAQYCSKMRAR